MEASDTVEINKDFTFCHGTMRCQQCETCRRYMLNIEQGSLWMIEPSLDEDLNCEMYFAVDEERRYM